MDFSRSRKPEARLPRVSAGAHAHNAYSDLKLSSTTIGPADSLTVSFKVTNTGKRAGKETSILYLRDEVASITPAGKRVKRFSKIYLEPGQSKTLTFTLGLEDLQFINLDNKPVAEPGDFTVLVSGLAQMFTLK